MVTGKLNIRLTDKDQLVGFGHWSFEQRPNGGLSLTVPADSVLAQESRTKVFKGEWQRKWSDRLSSTVMVGYFGNERQAVPVVDPATSPSRLDTATGVQSGAGWAPFTSTRWKPQSTGQISYHLPTEKVGSHDLKVGWDWQIDRNGPAWSEASGAIRYLDNSAYGRATSLTDVFVDRILFANVPNQGETDHNQHTDFFGQDVVARERSLDPEPRPARGQAGHLPHGDQQRSDPDGHLRPPERPSHRCPRAVGRGSAGGGRGRSDRARPDHPQGVLRTLLRQRGQRPSGSEPGRQAARGARVPGPQRERDLRRGAGARRAAGGERRGAHRVDPGFELPYTDEVGLSLEQELARDLAVRFAFVHKRYRNWWDSVNVAQALNLTSPVTATCTGCPPEFEGSNINLLTVPDDQTLLVDPRIMNVPVLPTTGGNDTDMGFTTWEVALTRRFRDNFFLTASFDKHDRDELRTPEASTSPFVADPLEQGWFQNHSADVPNRQETKYWTAKLLTRYQPGGDFGMALNLRFQSGFPWAPVHHLLVPNVGTKAIFLTDLKENRSDDVAVVDLRLDKSFNFGGRYRLTAIADVYNLLNANPVTNFIVNTGSRFEDVVEWLPAMTLKLGLRFQF